MTVKDFDQIMTIGGIVCIVGISIALIVHHIWSNMKRSQEVAKLAQQLNMRFTSDDSTILNSLKEFEIFSVGHSQQVTRVLTGEIHGDQVTTFDYTCMTGTGKHSHTHTNTIFWFKSDRLNLPRFIVWRRGAFAWLSDSTAPAGQYRQFGREVLVLDEKRTVAMAPPDHEPQLTHFADIDLPSHTVFSSKFWLRGDDERRVRALFDGELSSFLFRMEANAAYGIEGAPGNLLVYRELVPLVNDIPEKLAMASQVFQIAIEKCQ